MKTPTLKDLRTLAKERGLTGYSRMSKEDLQRALSRPAARVPPIQKASGTARGRKKTTKPAETAATTTPDPTLPKTHAEWNAPQTPRTQLATDEQRIESAKYRTTMAAAPANATATNLGEDIDRLPVLREPMLCLLPQKPGVLHAYWHLPVHATSADFKLRLCRIDENGSFVPQDEVALPNRAGTWYFHVPEHFGGAYAALQLGFYSEGAFVSTMTCGMPPPPSRYASGRTDPRWWISEETFRELYRKAGGDVTGARPYGWNAFGSSERHESNEGHAPAWPGNTSSRSA